MVSKDTGLDFFVLEKPRPDTAEDKSDRTDAIKEEGFKTREALSCPECKRPLTSLRWLPPYRIEVETWGRDYGDIIEIGDDVIVSERFVQLFRSEKLKGLCEFEPVEVFKVIHHRGKPKKPIPAYFKSSVARSPTTVDHKASEFVWSDESAVCPVCLSNHLKRYKRIVIKVETWLGEDVFFPRGGTEPIVSQRFKSFWEQFGFLGAVLIPALSYAHDFYPWERPDWHVQLFDETVNGLRSGNEDGRFDHFLRAMSQLREKVAMDSEFEWMDAVGRLFGGKIEEVADAASEAYSKLTRRA